MVDMPASLLSAAPVQPALGLLPQAPGLVLGRVHELTGPSRASLALMLAGRMTGTVVWISGEAARPGQWSGLMPQGAARWCDPDRLLFVSAPKASDRLWAMEETLRAGIACAVIAELEAPPGLVPVRRLLLAAEGRPVLGLLLTPEGAAPGIESRWSLTPAHRPGLDAWRLALLRARMVPPATWEVTAPIPA